MEDDDFMLNIAQPTRKIVSQSKDKAKQNKKLKYTVKFKKDQVNNRKNYTKNFQYNLLPTEQRQIENKRQEKDQTNPMKQKQQGEISYKRERNYEKEDNIHKLNGNKRLKPQFNRSRDRLQLNNSRKKVNNQEFKPQNVKIQTPLQIKLQQIDIKNNMDTSPLEEFNIHQLLKDSLIKNSVFKLTPIQSKCFNPIFNGKDVIAKASTGSGKTLAYTIPIVNQYIQKKIITQRNCGTVMLVICPSRQLCIQGQREVLRCLKRFPFIVPGCLLGGEQTNHEKMRLRKGVNILFATPGRLIYHLKNTKSFKIQNLKTLIFQQADRTLDMGFQHNIIEILKLLQQKTNLEYIQKILVSAHFNDKVQSLLKNLSMNNPKYIGFQGNQKSQQVDEQDMQQINKKEINISKNLKQQYVLMTEQERIPMLISYLKLISNSKVMIFVNTIDEVQYLDFLLSHIKFRNANGQNTEERIENRRIFKIHGDLDQKYRTNTYLQFRKQKNAIMVSTEVASRGLDFPDLNHIILFDVPQTITDYGNRVGRTARYNSTGVSLLMLHYQQSDYAQQIRYYCPTLQLLDKEILFETFQQYLRKMNIGQKGLYYLEGIVRGLVKDDDEKYQLARKAYVSMLRAYAKMKDKHTFAVKKLDLKLLGRCFGINSTGGQERRYNAKAKESHLQSVRKRRRVQSIKKLQVSQYL